MYISLNWLKDFVDIKLADDLSHLKNVVVGYVKKVEKHPNADRLKVAQVDVGNETLQIVCGGTNLKEKIYVPVAKVGAVLPGNFEIKKAKLRGTESNGMICHLSELGLAEDEGYKISPIKKAEPGTPLSETLKTSNDLTIQQLADLLTLRTAEVEQVQTQGNGLSGVIVGELLEFKKHPDADKLHVAKVNIGKKEPIQLIFGSMVKMKIGNRVPVAVAPTTLPSGIKINKKEIRGVMTTGMLCLDQELGLKKDGVSIQYFPNEKPGTPITKAMGLNDTVLEFDNKSLTHRPDLWGHYGIAREIAAITDKKLKPYKPKVKIPTKGESPKVEVKDKDLCPRYCGLIINNITVEQSPQWLKNRLLATDHSTYNNIVDVTNYVSTELGQPMHAFDKSYIKKGIVVRRAKKNEKIKTLDDKKRTLTEDMLVIADHEKPVAIAGVMGGENSEINAKTTSIILEAANFNSTSIRQTSTKLGLRTDAVQKFEKALDPELAQQAILRAAELILQLCPNATIGGPITDIKDYKSTPLKLTLDTNRTRAKIGIEIKNSEIKKILESLEFKVAAKGKDKFTVTVPSFRATKDVTIEDDLIEEVARIYSYDKIPATLPHLPTRLPQENTERFKKHRARELFSYGLGFDEVYNYSFYSKQDLENCQMTEEGHIKLLNYLSEDQTHLRTSLIPNILKNLTHNIKYFPTLKLYEIGRTYKEIGQYYPLEEKCIAGAVLTKTDQPFYEAKGTVEQFLNHFKIPANTVAEVKNAPYAHPQKSMSYIDQNGQTIAKVFTLHPKVAQTYDLKKQQIALFEINFSEALKLADTELRYSPLAKFPSTDFDVSILIDKNVEVATIKNAIKQSNPKLIKSVTLFDIYEGENIDKDKKAVAYKIVLQADDRTLEEQETTAVQNKVFKNIKSLGGTIRGS